MAKKKAARKKPKTNRLKDLDAALEQELTVQLEVRPEDGAPVIAAA